MRRIFHYGGKADLRYWRVESIGVVNGDEIFMRTPFWASVRF